MEDNFKIVATCHVAYNKKQNIAELKQRCQAAADHNQALLEQMRSSMANDFEQWLSQTFN